MNQENFIKALNMLSENDMVNPYTSVIDLTPQETNMNINNILKIDRPGRGENDHQKVPLCGGTCIFRKEAIAKIGGWNEDFIGWGAEDDELSIRVKKYLKWTELKGSCYHLYHSRPAPDPTNYNRNLTLLNKISTLTDQQTQSMIQKMTTKSGMKNKYDN
jgi:predicted glycosyltransferase involved in capsule biosynthesis